MRGGAQQHHVRPSKKNTIKHSPPGRTHGEHPPSSVLRSSVTTHTTKYQPSHLLHSLPLLSIYHLLLEPPLRYFNRSQLLNFSHLYSALALKINLDLHSPSSSFTNHKLPSNIRPSDVQSLSSPLFLAPRSTSPLHTNYNNDTPRYIYCNRLPLRPPPKQAPCDLRSGLRLC